MAQRILLSVILALIFVLSLFAAPLPVRAAFELMDGRLILNGFVKETWYVRTEMNDREDPYHDSRFDYMQTAGLLEALYTVHDDQNYTIRLFGGVKGWWQKVPHFDEQVSRSMAHRDRKDYTLPRSFDDDILTEAYIDILKGPWQIRIGKQIVQWGQLDVNRVADVVNPLDLRFGVPGVDAWEEIKRGVTMIRAMYQSQLPGTLLFEFIFNPGDFKGFMLPYQGTHWGPDYSKNAQFNPGYEMGFFSWIDQKWKRDMPGWNLKENYEIGGRVQGYTFGTDWTLLIWNARADGPIANKNRVGAFAFQYVQAGLASMLQGGGPEHPVRPGDWPSERIFKFKRYTTIGGTAQRPWDWLHNTTWDLEWFYEIGSPMNKGDGGSSQSVTDEVRRDVLGTAIKVSDRWRLPKSVCELIQTDKKLEISFTLFREQIFNHDHDLVVADRYHRPRDSVTEACSLFLRQELWHTSWNFTFIGNYYFRTDGWMAVPVMTYMFPENLLGGGLRADVGAKFYGRKRHKVIGNAYDSKDSIILRLRYEF